MVSLTALFVCKLIAPPWHNMRLVIIWHPVLYGGNSDEVLIARNGVKM